VLAVVAEVVWKIVVAWWILWLRPADFGLGARRGVFGVGVVVVIVVVSVVGEGDGVVVVG